MLNIKELRTKKGITQTELANNIGVTIRTIQHWEKGTKNITLQKLEKINAEFGLNMQYVSYTDLNPETLKISESSSEYKSIDENSDKIELLEEKLKLKTEQLDFYKEQIGFLKNKLKDNK